MKRSIQIGCNTLIFKDKKLLLGKRKNCTGEGTWGLPGGHLEVGETLEDAAIREAKEELGIEIKKLKFISVTDGANFKDHYIQVNFLVEKYSGKIKVMEPEKCQAWEFFSLTSLPEVFFSHKNIIEAYIKNEFYLS